jgi:hypothetical protein
MHSRYQWEEEQGLTITTINHHRHHAYRDGTAPLDGGEWAGVGFFDGSITVPIFGGGGAMYK